MLNLKTHTHKTNEKNQNRNRPADIENKLMFVKGEEGGKMGEMKERTRERERNKQKK